jgi:hypothetical protein
MVKIHTKRLMTSPSTSQNSQEGESSKTMNNKDYQVVNKLQYKWSIVVGVLLQSQMVWHDPGECTTTTNNNNNPTWV